MIKKDFTKNFRKTDWKIISYFVSFTFFIWLLLQLSKTTTHTFEVQLIIENLPVEIELEHKNLEVAVEMSGFQRIKKIMRTPQLILSADDELQLKKNKIRLNSRQVKAVIKNKFDVRDTSKIDFRPKEIAFIEKEKKLISIRFKEKISFEKGYNSLSGINYSSKQVEVVAPDFILDTLSTIEAESLILPNLSNNQEGKIELINPAPKFIELSQTNLNYQLQVEATTEKEFQIPVEVENLPTNFSIKTFPELIKIKFEVPVSAYEEIQPEDFKIKIDFNARLEGQSVLFPKLTRCPKNVLNPKVFPVTIDYLLKAKKDE